ncbi:dual 3',5'-cyclic-AMP and -GMP phosphodiesterase 11 [Sarotherodon galilaeus]
MEKKGSEKNRHVVPWLNKAELDQVRDYLYSMDSSLQGFALDRISAWRTRCADSFPVEVDCTADLVRCQMRDLSGQLTGDDLILMYGTALVRFWVVDLRNEIMHGELPSLKCCQRGCKVALEWLQQEFWSRQLGGAPDERWDLQSHGEDEDVKRQEDELVARQKEDAATGSSIPGASAPARPAEGHQQRPQQTEMWTEAVLSLIPVFADSCCYNVNKMF